MKCALSFINAQNVKPVVFRRLEIGGQRESSIAPSEGEEKGGTDGGGDKRKQSVLTECTARFSYEHMHQFIHTPEIPGECVRLALCRAILLRQMAARKP